MAIPIIYALGNVSGELKRFEQPSKGDGSLSFLVIGDWGRRGAFNQSQVAFQVHFSSTPLLTAHSLTFVTSHIATLIFLKYPTFIIRIHEFAILASN